MAEDKKKNNTAAVGHGITTILLGILILVAVVYSGPCNHSSAPQTNPYLTGQGIPPLIIPNPVDTGHSGINDRAPAKHYLAINPNRFGGFNVNAYEGGGKYIHWMLVDTDVSMEVCINGDETGLHREFARANPHWVRFNPTGVINRVDFRMTPGDRGTVKSAAQVEYWYDNSPNDEYQ
jgi:hypothetical protein